VKVSTRIINGTLVVDLEGPFPSSEAERLSAQNAFRDALSGRSKDFIITFQEIDYLNSHDLGFFVALLTNAGVKMGGLGSGPFVRIVSDKNRIRSVFSVVDSPILAFATEGEALSSLRERDSGCLAVTLLTFTIAFILAWRSCC
jgi:hypothetical protein